MTQPRTLFDKIWQSHLVHEQDDGTCLIYIDRHLVHEITQIAQRFDPAFDASTIELRPSSSGKYLGVTVTVTATSREQLDDLYRAFTSHPLVKVVL